jgi:hypothetical protein
VIVDPKLIPCCNSLKKEALLRVAIPGSEPVTEPEFTPPDTKVPFVEKSEIDTIFDCVPPPAMKSKVRVAPVPERLDVLIVTS